MDFSHAPERFAADYEAFTKSEPMVLFQKSDVTCTVPFTNIDTLVNMSKGGYKKMSFLFNL